jgi:hypothetical protein
LLPANRLYQLTLPSIVEQENGAPNNAIRNVGRQPIERAGLKGGAMRS